MCLKMEKKTNLVVYGSNFSTTNGSKWQFYGYTRTLIYHDIPRFQTHPNDDYSPGETDAGVYQVSDLPVFGCPLLLVAQLIRRQLPSNYQRKLLVKWTLVYQKIWERPLRLVSDWFLGMFSMEECVISQFSQWQIQVFAFGILLACWLLQSKKTSSKMFQVLWCFLARRIIPIKIG